MYLEGRFKGKDYSESDDDSEDDSDEDSEDDSDEDSEDDSDEDSDDDEEEYERPAAPKKKGVARTTEKKQVTKSQGANPEMMNKFQGFGMFNSIFEKAKKMEEEKKKKEEEEKRK